MDESKERGADCWSHILSIRKEWGPVYMERREWAFVRSRTVLLCMVESGGRQAQREIRGQTQRWEHMDGFCVLNVRRNCEKRGVAGDLERRNEI